MGRKKLSASTSEEPEWWLLWFRGSRACCDSVLYEYLPGTMTEREIDALQEAVRRDGNCEFHTNKRGGGVVRDARAPNGSGSS